MTISVVAEERVFFLVIELVNFLEVCVDEVFVALLISTEPKDSVFVSSKKVGVLKFVVLVCGSNKWLTERLSRSDESVWAWSENEASKIEKKKALDNFTGRPPLKGKRFTKNKRSRYG